MTEAQAIAARFREAITIELHSRAGLGWNDLDDHTKWCINGALDETLLEAGLDEAVRLLNQGIDFVPNSSDKIYLLIQMKGYRDLLIRILAALRGSTSG